MLRTIALLAATAGALALAATAGATTTARCVDRDAPYNCRATTSEDKATAAIVNAGRFSTATWRLACTRGHTTTVSVGAISRRGRTVLLNWTGKADCTLTARFHSSRGPWAAGSVALIGG